MTCSACQAAVERSVKKLAGVQEVSVNLLANNMTVEFDESQTSVAAIIAAVETAGYEASEDQPQEAVSQAETSRGDHLTAEIGAMRRRVLVSFIF